MAPTLALLEDLFFNVSLVTGAHQACLESPAWVTSTPPHPSSSSSSPSSPSSLGSAGALAFLQAAYETNARGARLLLAGAARARIRAYPSSLSSDIAQLVKDAAAGVVLALEVEEDAAAFVAGLLGGSSGVAAGAAAAGSRTPSCEGYFGCLTLAHFERALRTLGEEEARAALLPPRARASLLLLVSEKRILAGWAGWAPGAEGAEGVGL